VTGKVLRRIAIRVAAMVAVMWGAATLAFVALHLLPGNPVETLLGGRVAPPSTVREIRQQLGLGNPVLIQYLTFLGHLLSGNLGQSFQLEQPVTQVIGGQLLATVELAAFACALAFAGAGLVALLTCGRSNRVLRTTSMGAELVGISMPSFWLAILLLTAFSFQIHLFPVAGNGGFSSLVLPAITLAVPIGAVLSQILRNGLDTALRQPFILSARARGMREWKVRTVHALRHALLPVITLSGWIVGSLLSGAVIVETVFGRQGIGRVAETAVTGEDMPVVIGVVLLSALVYVTVNTAVDLLYLWIDPRLRAR
jgi:peptide/nickel transport system permease protein